MTERSKPTLQTDTLETLKARFKDAFSTVVKTEKLIETSRVTAAKTLVEIQRRVGLGGGQRWWVWFRDNMKGSGCSESNAKKLIRIGKADDPIDAHEKEKAKTRTRVAASRAKSEDNGTVQSNVRSKETASCRDCSQCPQMVKVKGLIISKYGNDVWNQMME